MRLTRRLVQRSAAARCALAAAIAAFGLAARTASATPIVEIVFTAHNGAPIAPSASVFATAGDSLTAEIRLTADAAGVSSYGISVAFDADLADEVDAASATELLPAGFSFNITPGTGAITESNGVGAGSVDTFEAATFGLGPTSSTFAIGTISFTVSSNVATDGIDISPVFHTGIDGLFDNGGSDIGGNATLVGASVNVPEPSAVVLVGVGAVVLRVTRGRRSG